MKPASLRFKILCAVAPFAIVATIVTASYPKYHRDKTACEAQGRFYWRGNCLPNECRVVRP